MQASGQRSLGAFRDPPERARLVLRVSRSARLRALARWLPHVLGLGGLALVFHATASAPPTLWLFVLEGLGAGLVIAIGLSALLQAARPEVVQVDRGVVSVRQRPPWRRCTEIDASRIVGLELFQSPPMRLRWGSSSWEASPSYAVLARLDDETVTTVVESLRDREEAERIRQSVSAHLELPRSQAAPATAAV